MSQPGLPEHVIKFLDAAELHAEYVLEQAKLALEGAARDAARDFAAEAAKAQHDADLRVEHHRQQVADAEAELAKWHERGDEAVNHAYGNAVQGERQDSVAHAEIAGGGGETTGA